MARQRNNIYAIAADAVELALDTAGTIGSVVGGIAHMVGIGNSTPEKSEGYERQEAAAKPRSHKAVTRKRSVRKTRAARMVRSVKKTGSRRASRKAA